MVARISKAGEEVKVEARAGGTTQRTPSRPEVSKVIKSTMKDYAHTMKKLA